MGYKTFRLAKYFQRKMPSKINIIQEKYKKMIFFIFKWKWSYDYYLIFFNLTLIIRLVIQIRKTDITFDSYNKLTPNLKYRFKRIQISRANQWLFKIGFKKFTKIFLK